MKLVLIKCGGSVLEKLQDEFFASIHSLQQQGYQCIFVHGGGPNITKALEAYNVQSEFVNGLRKTTADTFHVVESVLSGQTNRKLVSQLTKHGFQAIGINGSDANLLQADFINKEELGYVGEITNVEPKIIKLLLHEGYLPVVTPIAVTKNGTKLNVNADYAAAAVAHAMNVDECIFVTNVQGVLVNGKTVPVIGRKQINDYIRDGIIYGGMIPKLTSALSILEKGLQCVTIVSGKMAIYENGNWNGTKIMEREKVFM
ncbi:acetylglutamate kinase [Bacillaceae bacterium Marseille-Q3522]|nr:acetylglutamate kinase [Bacillaceae bacterium Marseille-Q3522]